LGEGVYEFLTTKGAIGSWKTMDGAEAKVLGGLAILHKVELILIM
jgi:hypothetical protein